MEPNSSVTRPGYLLAGLLFFSPLLDIVLSTWPPHFGEERWRFGAIGALGNATLVPLLGVFVAIALAVLYDHRRFRRVLGWLTAVFAVLVGVLTIFFVLDFFQARTMVRPQYIHAVNVASSLAIAKLLLASLFLVLVARVGLTGPRASSRRKEKERAPIATPLMPTTSARSE